MFINLSNVYMYIYVFCFCYIFLFSYYTFFISKLGQASALKLAYIVNVFGALPYLNSCFVV